MPPKKKCHKAKPKSDATRKERSQHENLLQKVRYHVSRSKKEIRKAYSKASRAEKQKWASTFEKTGNFDFVVTRKTKYKGQKESEGVDFEWLTADGVYTAEGWSEAIKGTPSGQRAAARAEAILATCRKLKNHTMESDQHGEMLYKRSLHKGSKRKEKGECLSTSLFKKAEMKDGEVGSSTSSTSRSTSSSTTDSSDEEEEEGEGDTPKKQKEDTASTTKAEQMLGKCAALQALLSAWDPTTMVWLKPWEKNIKEAQANIVHAQDKLTNIVTGADSTNQKDAMQDATKKLEEAQKLHDLVHPINQSVLAANALMPGSSSTT